MIYGSVCSGIEAATVAWHPLGWRPSFFSEIDPFPRSVLAHHYPRVPTHGDFTTIRLGQYAPIDLLVGGTPCQDFSVAGLRAGMAGARGNLTLEFLKLAQRLRPRWLVWENVPGVLSSNGGRDFGAFLGALGELGYGFAYRVLDAQYFGVPQRRRRVFVVGYLGDWRPAAAVLFERHSLQGHPAPRREARESVAHPVAQSLTSSGRGVSRTGETRGQDSVIACPAISPALKARDYKGPSSDGDGDGAPLIVGTLSNNGKAAGSAISQDARSGFDAGEDGTGRGTPLVPVAFSCKDHGADAGGLSPTLRSMGQVAVTFAIQENAHVENLAHGPSGKGFAEELAYTLEARNKVQAAATSSAVRRLTPRECERLQGFPDDRDTVTIRVCQTEEEKRAIASSVPQDSTALSHDQSAPVLARVLIDLERPGLRLLSPTRSPLTVSDAADAKWSALPIPAADFVRLAALMTRSLARATRVGREASLRSIRGSSPLWNGSASVLLSGSEISALASDAEQFTAALSRCSTFTMSEAGPISPVCEQTLEILSCCAASVIAGCIPETIRQATSYGVQIEVVGGYTLVPHRGKPAADGPRYKALGNSMAVPVMAWIGRRIALVEKRITRPKW